MTPTSFLKETCSDYSHLRCARPDSYASVEIHQLGMLMTTECVCPSNIIKITVADGQLMEII